MRFAGVFGYEGHLLRAWPEEEKIRQIEEALGWLVGAAETIRGAGIEVPIVTAGGTGSYRYSAKVPGITELEAGGGCLMDLMYREDCHVGPETGLDFALKHPDDGRQPSGARSSDHGRRLEDALESPPPSRRSRTSRARPCERCPRSTARSM